MDFDCLNMNAVISDTRTHHRKDAENADFEILRCYQGKGTH